MRTYTPLPAPPNDGKPRVFVPLEDRKRDLSGLLEFGTVVQMFDARSPWQLPAGQGADLFAAARDYFVLHEFGDRDYLALVGDPATLATVAAAAGDVNRGAVRALRWDRVACAACGSYRRSCGRVDCPRTIAGRYVLVPLVLRRPT